MGMISKSVKDKRFENHYFSDPDEVIEIGLKFKINPRWYKKFIGFLQELEGDSMAGHSALVGFFAGGDGDFRFRWTYSDDKESKLATKKVEKYFNDRKYYQQSHANSCDGFRPAAEHKCEIVFDAG